MKPLKNLPRRKWLQLTSLSALTGLTSKLIGSPQGRVTDDCPSTPRQEVGPFEPMEARKQVDTDIDLTMVKGRTEAALGQVVKIQGQVLDQDCKPIPEAILEVWQANHHGKYHHEYDKEGKDDPNFQGWARIITDEEGKYQFKTILPGLYGRRTRHIHFKVQKRGYHELVSQLYFTGEERNATDGIYNSLTHDEQQKVTIDLGKKFEGNFSIYLEKVDTDKLPIKVLEAYVGSYRMLYEETNIGGFFESQFGITGPVNIDIVLEGHQLYMDTPFTQKCEIFWKAKDTFDSTSMYASTTQFKRRDDDGEVLGFEMLMNDSDGGKINCVRVGRS